MNEKLKILMDLIQKSETLKDKERTTLLEELKAAEKDFEITAFKLERTEKVKKTTAILLEETIEELEQKRKAVEAQNRELEIEAALEKVRSAALAMTEPADMVEVCRIVSDQLELLGITDIRNVQTVVIYEPKGTYLNYQYFTSYKKSAIEEAVYKKHPSANKMAQEMKKSGEAFYTDSFSGEELNIFREYRKSDGQFPDPIMDKTTAVHFYFFSIGMGALGISTYDRELSENDVNLFKRFRNVFELAYRRFVDIETALGQARESQIQLALERIRAKTMAMHRSDELLETARVLYQQFSELGEDPDQLTIGFVNESERILELWLSRLGNRMEQMFRVPIDEPIVINKIYTAWKEGKKSAVIDISGEDLEKYNNFRKSSTDFKVYNDINNSEKGTESRRVMHCAFFPKGLLSLATTEPRPEETVRLLERFAGVFDLTYTRFLDLQKAEAQAREAEVQLALERVRARTMAMQKSEELAEAAYELLMQFKSLGEVPDQITIGLINDQQKEIEFWLTLGGNKVEQKVILSAGKSEVINSLVQGWKDKKKSLILDLSGQRLKEYQNYRNTISRNAGIPMPGIREDLRRVIHASYFSKGMLTFSSSQPQAESTLLLLERFAAVFDLTYTRFLDLQKAEAQAREAQIEASLERVRSRAMAMQDSSDLSEASGIIFTELRKLGIAPLRSGVVLLTKNSLKANIYATTISSESDELALIGTIMFSGHFCFEEQYEAWMKMENYFPVLTGEDLKSYYQVLSNQLPIQLPGKQKIQ